MAAPIRRTSIAAVMKSVQLAQQVQKFGWDFFIDGLRIHRAKGRTHTGIARAVGTAAAAGPVGRAIVRRFAGLILMCQSAHAPELHIVTNALQENGSLRHR